jgi:hypothetical protein
MFVSVAGSPLVHNRSMELWSTRSLRPSLRELQEHLPDVISALDLIEGETREICWVSLGARSPKFRVFVGADDAPRALPFGVTDDPFLPGPHSLRGDALELFCAFARGFDASLAHRVAWSVLSYVEYAKFANGVFAPSESKIEPFMRGGTYMEGRRGYMLVAKRYKNTLKKLIKDHYLEVDGETVHLGRLGKQALLPELIQDV